MCGIAGLYQSAAIDSAQAEQSILEMTQSLTHRGPDDTNIYIISELVKVTKQKSKSQKK